MPGIAIIVLAAGASRRFGADDKLLADVGGEPLVVGVVRRLAGLRVAGVAFEVIAVVAAGDGPVAGALDGLPVEVRPRLVVNGRAGEGMGTSIAAGVGALAGTLDGALVTPGDMPLLSAELAARLVTAFVDGGCARPAHPVLADGSAVGPVVWPRSAFSELMALDGDGGGRHLLAGRPTIGIQLSPVETALLADIDTPADLARLSRS